jgi:hypothetical protein
MSFWDFVAWIFWFYVLFAYLMVLFSIIGDLFRDKELNGWVKAVWILFLVFFPVLTALVYLIARGRGMSERSAAAASSARAQTDDYIRSVAATTPTPTDEIAKAKALLDSGSITESEFEQLKAKALVKAA